MVDAATKLGYTEVLEQWHKAQRALAMDPAEALTRASQLVETLCKHIMAAKGHDIKKKPDVQDLFRGAADCLGLSPDPKTSGALKRINSGLFTVVLNVGTLRNHASIAHGTSPSSRPVTFSQARLAVNAVGVLATFLMDALIADSASSTAPQAQP